MPQPKAPTHRPTWFLILSSIMLLTGGYSFVVGMLKVKDPGMVIAIGAGDTAESEDEVVLNRQLAAVRAAAVMPHVNAVRTEAAIEIVLALFTLYATAAVIARDRNGRRLALAVGLLGIVYQLGTLPVYLSLMRDYAEQGAGLLARAALLGAGATSRLNGDDVAHRLRSAIVGGPIIMCAIGVVGSLVLLGFFGGRRGRALYGVDVAASRPAKDRAG